MLGNLNVISRLKIPQDTPYNILSFIMLFHAHARSKRSLDVSCAAWSLALSPLIAFTLFPSLSLSPNTKSLPKKSTISELSLFYSHIIYSCILSLSLSLITSTSFISSIYLLIFVSFVFVCLSCSCSCVFLRYFLRSVTTSKILISGIPMQTRFEDIEPLLKPYGIVKQCEAISSKDQNTQTVHITFENPEQAQRYIPKN